MLIILEGVDKVGKTTAAHKFCEKFNAEYLHFSEPDKDPTDYFIAPVIRAGMGENIVCDRHLLGEKIYAKAMGRESKWRAGDYESMLSKIEKIPSMLIIAWEDLETIERRFSEEGEDYITFDQAADIQRTFIEEGHRIAQEYPNMLVMTYQPTANSLEMINF